MMLSCALVWRVVGLVRRRCASEGNSEWGWVDEDEHFRPEGGEYE